MRIVFTILAISTLVACQTPRAYNYIDAEARPLLTSMDSVLIVKESEIGTEIDTANMTQAMGGGLLWAVVDAGVNSARTGAAEELAAPLRDKLIDFDFGAKLEKALEANFAEVGISGLNEVELVRGETAEFREETVSSSEASAVIFIDAVYKFSMNFSSIIGMADVKVFPTSADLAAYQEKADSDDNLTEANDNIYRNSLSRATPLTSLGVGEDRDMNAAILAEASVESLAQVADETAMSLAKAISDDLMIDDQPES